jgi:hypothetical protein
MSLEHKAFEFNYEPFLKELKPKLEIALLTNDITRIEEFIAEHISELKDPYEGEPLDGSWSQMIEVADSHQYGDFALTKYYDPGANIGLGYDWQDVQKRLLLEAPELAPAVLGKPLGTKNCYFDPGKSGSYFQSPDQVQNNIKSLEGLARSRVGDLSELNLLLEMLAKVSQGKGLYVTF